MNIRPLHDRLVVRRLEEETTTAGGIVLPDSAKDKPARGRVVSVGDGKLLDDGTRGTFQVKPGDRVLCVPVYQVGLWERFRVTEMRAIPLDPHERGPVLFRVNTRDGARDPPRLRVAEAAHAPGHGQWRAARRSAPGNESRWGGGQSGR